LSWTNIEAGLFQQNRPKAASCEDQSLAEFSPPRDITGSSKPSKKSGDASETIRGKMTQRRPSGRSR
ncbi:hypothetical protein MCB86_21580, partial [Pseudomonas sp. KSR10]|uniref:hypothetical protein n=1 Tax=Pseudomonas sp. KSR10 TaxID=2916654 RepID=UPI001EF96565